MKSVLERISERIKSENENSNKKDLNEEEIKKFQSINSNTQLNSSKSRFTTNKRKSKIYNPEQKISNFLSREVCHSSHRNSCHSKLKLPATTISKEIENTDETNNPQINQEKKEYYKRFALERINFIFEEYGSYPDMTFHPSVFFFKFLAIKPDYEGKKVRRLKIFIPDTIVMNDIDSNYWIYTDLDGSVVRTETFSDADVLEKFKSITQDDKELLAVSKMPIYKSKRLEGNNLELLNKEELEKYIFSKNSNPYALQRFVKCRGPKAFLCRAIWRRTKPPYVYILTNKANYHDHITATNQYIKYVVNSKLQNSYSPFFATSGKHLEETIHYMNNIVKFIESHSDILFEELVGDFVK